MLLPSVVVVLSSVVVVLPSVVVVVKEARLVILVLVAGSVAYNVVGLVFVYMTCWFVSGRCVE